ncbi:hypothetical protein KUTeg_017891 [Tegillarca granosa]|uniref:Amine oxidase n=1 Tax=Tegillarca granosa TaxID=220873 RepID=A0ABQ9EG98_TEGGR|nr:hypothetical protein KUTeg_017891 [Tegillarca granosa]
MNNEIETDAILFSISAECQRIVILIEHVVFCDKNIIEEEKPDQSARRWRCFSLILLLVLTTCLAAIAAIIIYYELNVQNESYSQSKRLKNRHRNRILNERQNRKSLFHDMTYDEVKNLMNYIYQQSDLNISRPEKVVVASSYLYVVELHLPNKSKALNYLDFGETKPPREAKLVLMRGDKSPALVEEYIVGPLHNISYHRLYVSKNYQKPAPFLFRPLTRPEKREVLSMLKYIDKVLKYVLEESFEASFFKCEPRCLTLSYFTPASPAVTGQDARRMWYWAHQKVDYYVLNPVNFFLLFNLDGNDPSKYRIEKVVYAQQTFDSPEELVNAFTAGVIRKSSIPFPENNIVFSYSHLRGSAFPKNNLRSPKQIEPDGKRYSINNNHVEYMSWSFDFRMSSISGPQLFDIRYKNERIIYELSLQEIVIFHSGHRPWIKFADYVMSGLLIGSHSRMLVSGLDCPSHASFLSSARIEEDLGLLVHTNSFCVFEQSTGLPLRRHYSYSKKEGQFYTGLEDIVLTFRTIITLFQHDFIIDFTFHQNGVIDTKVTTSGYMLPTIFTPFEESYGFQINEKLISNIFQQNLHFKVDIDIHGTKNRFETLNIEPEVLPESEQSSSYSQLKFERNLVMTELQGVYRRNFSAPKYFIFYNNRYKSDYNAPKSYQIIADDGVPQMVSGVSGNEPSVSWIRHQMAVSKYKDDEKSSSSIYAMWDAKEPVVNFQSYLDDNESIVDQDLVVWITLGSYHIPHLEDFPLKSTTGKQISFIVQPFNYFEENPSMASRDALRISTNKRNKGEYKYTYENYGLQKTFYCETELTSSFVKNLMNNSNIFEP